MMLVNARGQEGEGSGKRAEQGSGVLVVMLCCLKSTCCTEKMDLVNT